MRSFRLAFKLAIVICFYLSIANFILLGLIWGFSNSNTTFLEILYFARKPVLRLVIGGIFGLSFISTLIYLSHSSFKPILPHSITYSISSIISALRVPENDEFTQSIIHINKLIITMILGVVGVFFVDYLFAEETLRKSLLPIALTIFPITVASMIIFLLSVPLAIIVFYLGDFIKHGRS